MADYGSPLRDNALMLSLLEEYKLLPENSALLSWVDSQRWLNACSERAFSSVFCASGSNL
jgi:uncharacterized protein YfaS (alpha-2-macroglobulin family)